MILIVDTHNFLHRARAGFGEGEFSIVFNFIRNLRALVEQMKPTRVLMVLEGHPQHRFDLLPEYKANRVAEEGSTKHEQMKDFHRQKRLVFELLENFPVTLVKHSGFECDDTIYNIIKNSARSVDYVVVSNDSDFVQLLQEFENVKVYNPMKKEYVTAPEYDYVLWKSLRGDGSDNIPGLPGLGDKRAADLVSNPQKLENFLKKNDELKTQLARNLALIKFSSWSDEEASECTSSSPVKDWTAVRAKFENWKFASLLKEPSWSKLTSTFDKLWI